MSKEDIAKMTKEEFFAKFAKIVYCRDHKCLWNEDLPEGHFVLHNKNVTPFPEDAYLGVCGRSGEIGVTGKEIETGRGTSNSRLHILASCDSRSDKSLRGHMDFSRLIGQGGTF